ncbi:MAG: hypothetical protein D6723_11075 [Acidobacteria bacterium]|nr:MAG: hypothetical protein D6723_11075 [Acidobacteriota bacterium]
MKGRTQRTIMGCFIVALIGALTVRAEKAPQAHPPRKHRQKHRKMPKRERPHLTVKGAARGSGFRITWIHPTRGNFAEYDRLQVVRLTSAIGDRVPREAMEKYTEDLARSFEQTGIFHRVEVVDDLALVKHPLPGGAVSHPVGKSSVVPQGSFPSFEGWGTPFAQRPQSSSPPSTIPVAEGLMAPIRVLPPDAPLPQPTGRSIPKRPLDAPLIVADPDALPEEQKTAVASERRAQRTMIITGCVIYYKKGNRGLRMLGLGLGYHRFVVRFHIYDKELGQELAMGNISGEVSGGFLSIPGLTGDADGRKWVVTALVNRVERRRAKADR